MIGLGDCGCAGMAVKGSGYKTRKMEVGMLREVEGLLEEWRHEIARLRERYGDESRARVLEVAAEELQAAIHRDRKQKLTLEEARLWSGYSKSHLRALQRDGTLSQAGRRGKPAFLQVELPIKPGYEPVPPDNVRGMKKRRRRYGR